MSWRLFYGEKKNTYLGYLYTYLGITNLNVYLTGLYFTNLYLTILKQIQNALIGTQEIHYSPYFETQAGSLF